jgi:hypothetical protein
LPALNLLLISQAYENILRRTLRPVINVLAQGLGGVGVLQTAPDFLGMSSRDLRLNAMLATSTSPMSICWL